MIGSRGSVIPFFLNLIKSGTKSLPITDPRMTRFMITLDEGVELVWTALLESVGGEIFVKKIPSMNIIDIAKALAPEATLETVGIRPGEKLHEQMIGVEDAHFTYEYKGFYKILPNIHDWYKSTKRIGSGKRVHDDFSYTSENNDEEMTKTELLQILKSQGFLTD